METRKLQEVGGGTFTVSIPKEWAMEHSFEVGMQLQLYTHRDGSILIRSSEADVSRLDDATVAVDEGGPDAVGRLVRLTHELGFETITLRRDEPFSDAERNAARAAARDLVGTNVTAEADRAITVRQLLDTSSVSICQSIVQLQYVVVSLLRDAVEAFSEAADAGTRIRERAAEAHRSVAMVTRHFCRSLVSHAELDALDVSRAELFAYYATANRLGTVADHAVRIATAGARLSEPPAAETGTELRAVSDDAAEGVDDAVTAVLSEDAGQARQARRRCDDALDALDALEDRLYDGSLSGSVPAAAALSETLSNLRRVADCGHSVADTATRAAIRDANVDL